MKYRPEVDGLRAVAVIPVILFHAGFSTFSGGFVGVDIFFVISGYLITTIITQELERGRFSIVTFYERRARRILPALFFVIAACIPFAWLWLMPQDMRDFSQSISAVAAFGSNFLFWRESGYFDTAAELKPLLHTWSLAVEEQFYVLFPIFLLLFWRFGKRWVAALIAAALIISLGLAEFIVDTRPAAAFFLLPTRAWELSIGALTALILSDKTSIRISKVAAEALSAAGLILIAFSVFAYSKLTPFPSLYALVPTVGTALIILFASRDTAVGRLLSLKLMMGVGLISYSAYLWHQPLFAFARHRAPDSLSPYVLIGLCFLALLLAFFSWRYVERPFRRKELVQRRSVFTFASVGSLALLALGIAGHASGGFPGRLGPERAGFAAYFENGIPEWRYFEATQMLEKYRSDCDFYDLEQYRAGNATRAPRPEISSDCYTRNPELPHSVMIWGDSHAQQFRYGLDQNLDDSWQILQVATSGCSPRIVVEVSKDDFCDYSNWFALQTISNAAPEIVLLAQARNHDPATMDSLALKLHELGVSRIIFIGPVPRWRSSLPNVIAFWLWDEHVDRAFTGVDTEVVSLDKELQRYFESTRLGEYVSAVQYFCTNEGCLTHIGPDRRTGITSWDYGHLTPIASSLFAKDVLVPVLLDQTATTGAGS